MGVNYFMFDGESSLDYGVYVGGQGAYNSPQRDVSKISIPGRNGDLIKDNGRWLNISVPYNIVIMDTFRNRAEAVRAWLNRNTSYARLEDTYNPESYRLARFASSIEFETGTFNRTGRATIVFDCKPQRFLLSGDKELEFTTSPGRVFNPTKYNSRPLIRVIGSGSGTVTVGDYTIAVSDISTYVDIDSELQDCYIGSTSANDKVTLSNGFPLLVPGENMVGWTGGVTGVTVVGRWFTL